MGSCPSKAAGKTESEPDNDDPIKLNTLGETNGTADMCTNATPDGIDKDTATPESDTKPDTTSVDKDTTDGLLEAVLSASPPDITKDGNTTSNETAVDELPPPSPPPVDVTVDVAVDIPPPPSPPPVDEPTLSSFVDIPPPPSPPPIDNVPAPPSPPPIDNVPAPPSPPTIPDTNSKAESSEPASSQIAEPKETAVNLDTTVQLHPSTDPREGNVTIHETAAGTSPSAPKLSTFGHPVTANGADTPVDAANGNNVPAPKKLSTFGTPILAVETESSPNANNTAEQSKPDEKPVNDATMTTQSPVSKTEDTASLLNINGKNSSLDIQADAKTRDNGEAVEIKLVLDDIPPPLLLADDTVECNSLESAGETKKRLFGTEFDPEVDTVGKEKRSMVRFYILVIMAAVTFTLVAVAVALLLFINFADLNTILGHRAGGSPTSSENVQIKGEVRMRDLQLSSFQPGTEKIGLFKEDFINQTKKLFTNSIYSDLYRQTIVNVTDVREGSVIVEFTVNLRPIARSQSSTVVQDDQIYFKYKAAIIFLEQSLSGMRFKGSGVNVLKLDLYIGSTRKFVGVDLTTEKPDQSDSTATKSPQVSGTIGPETSPTSATNRQPSPTTESTGPLTPTTEPTSSSHSSRGQSSPFDLPPSSTTQTQATTTTVKTTQPITMSNVATQMGQLTTEMPSSDTTMTEKALTMTVTQSTTAMTSTNATMTEKASTTTASQPTTTTTSTNMNMTEKASTTPTSRPTTTTTSTNMTMTGKASTTPASRPTNSTTSTDMTTTEEAATTPMTQPTTATSTTKESSSADGRRRRETRSLFDIFSTIQFTREPTTNPLVPSITRYTHDILTSGCSPHQLQSCVQAGWSQATTRTPNRFNLWSESNHLMQIYTTLMQDVDLATQHGVEMHRIICSLLVPSCDDGLMGRNLPCRSACANFMRTLKDPLDSGALGALCNTSLPESESRAVCFQIHGQHSETGSACSSGHCMNGGTCFDLNGQAYCRCSEEFGGDRCQIDPCTPNPCANGGTCLGRAELITSYACGCLAGYHGKHCELSVNVTPTPSLPSEPVPTAIDVPACLDVLPYSHFISDTKAPGWGIVKPLASCSPDAQLMFCAMAHPEFYQSSLVDHQKAPCRDVCERVLLECDILFHALDRVFPGICEGLSTNPTEVKYFCATN